MAETWLWGDPHLGHANVIRHDKRPWPTIQEHDQGLIDNYRAVVRRDDTVIICGDFAWRDHLTYLAMLPGKKVMIIGTHDNMHQSAYDQFTQVIGRRKQPGIYCFTALDRVWCISHYHMRSWPSSHHGSYHVYAHSHGRHPEYSNVLATDCGVPVRRWSPVNLEVIKLQLDSRVEAWRASRPDDPEWETKREQIVRANLAQHDTFDTKYKQLKESKL